MSDSGFLELEAGTTNPGTPATGFVRIYPEGTGLKAKFDSGTVKDLFSDPTPLSNAVPNAVGTPSAGILSDASRADHVHGHGDQGGATEHTLVNPSSAGFMSPGDKTKLDGVAAGATQNQSDSYLLNRGNHTGTQSASSISDFSTAADARITVQKGTALGLAPLDATSKIAAVYLPSFVDDVLEYATISAFPVTGEAGVIYVDISSGLVYRWSGSVYVEISASPGSTDQVPEGATNKYFTDARAKTAVVDDAITDGVTDKAPSQNAVFDALTAIVAKAMLTPNDITLDTTVLSGFTWLRQNRTRVLGTTKIIIQSGGKFTVLA